MYIYVFIHVHTEELEQILHCIQAYAFARLLVLAARVFASMCLRESVCMWVCVCVCGCACEQVRVRVCTDALVWVCGCAHAARE